VRRGHRVGRGAARAAEALFPAGVSVLLLGSLLGVAAEAATDLPATAATPGLKSGSAPVDGGFFGQMSPTSRKEPIVIQSNQLEFNYQKNLVIYRGKVHVTQGDLIIDSKTLTVTFGRADDQKQGKADDPKQQAKAGDPKPAKDPKSGNDPKPANAEDPSQTKLDEVVAEGDVVITQGTRWATGGKAVFNQAANTVVLTENPVLHDGPNEVTGDRLIVYLGEGRSVVESGAQKRVSATLYPGSGDADALGSAKAGVGTKAAEGTKAATTEAKATAAPTAARDHEPVRSDSGTESTQP